jgi:hypothetical protein
MDDGMRLYRFDEVKDALAIPDIEFVVSERSGELTCKACLIPSCVSLRAKKGGALVIIDAVNVPA